MPGYGIAQVKVTITGDDPSARPGRDRLR
jgi:hypothetical protein